jgi:predicted small secreted protein
MKNFLIILLVLVSILMVGCGNKRISIGIGEELNYNYASVYAPDGTVVHSGELESWKDHDDSTVDLWFRDGYKFLAHSMNIVMSNKKN